MIDEHADGRVGTEHELSREQPIRQASGRVDVGARVHLGTPERLLRRHESRRPLDDMVTRERHPQVRRLSEGLDQSEVQDFDEVHVLAVAAEEVPDSSSRWRIVCQSARRRKVGRRTRRHFACCKNSQSAWPLEQHASAVQSVRHMSILFVDARLSTRAPGRSTTGLWLSVVLHGIFVVVLIVVPIRASEKPSTPRMQSRMVFIFPATELVKLPSAPVVAPRLRAPPAPPRPVRELARAEVLKPLPVAPIVATSVEPASALLVPAAPPRSNGRSKGRRSSVLLRPAFSSGHTARERARPQLPSRRADSEVRRPRRAAPQTDPAASRQVDSAAGRPRRVGPQTDWARCRRRGSIYGRVRPPSLPSRR